MTDITTLPVDKTTFQLANLPISLAAIFDVDIYNRLTHVAEVLSKAQGFAPPHLIGQPHACFAVVTRSMTWRLDPFAVAQSTYLVGGKVAYEAKLVQAILENSGQVQGNIKYELYGDWSKVQGKWKEIKGEKNGKKYAFAAPDWKDADEDGLGVTVSCQVKGETERRELNFTLREAYPRNSVLWATRPSQQIKSTACRAFASTVAPALFMGVPFESDATAGLRDITEESTLIDQPTDDPRQKRAEPIDYVKQGFEAYRDGVKFRDAPGHLSATDYDDWTKGWQDASKQEHGESDPDDTPEADENAHSPAESGDDGEGGEAVSRGKEDSPAQQPAARSLEDMLKDCGKNVQQISRLKHGYKAASEGESAYSEWFLGQFPKDQDLIEPFHAELQAFAASQSGDGT